MSDAKNRFEADHFLDYEKSSEPVKTPFKKLPDFEPWGYVAEVYLGGNENAGRSTYRVRRIKDNTTCLLKQVRFYESNWETIRQVTEREYQVLSALDHPQIPKAIDFLNPSDEGWIAVVQEFVEGSPLSDFSVNNDIGYYKQIDPHWFAITRFLNGSEMMEIAVSLVRVLVYLQKHKLCHLDIKPENIVIDAGLKPHLVDFGASLRLRSERDPQRSTMLGCTPGFIDPVILFKGARPTDSSDLYGVGCTVICKLLKLSTTEFSSRYGLMFSDASLDELVCPDSISEQDWAWLLSLISFKDLSVQPANAKAALQTYEQRYERAKPVTLQTAEKAPVVKSSLKWAGSVRTMLMSYIGVIGVTVIGIVAYDLAFSPSNYERDHVELSSQGEQGEQGEFVSSLDSSFEIQVISESDPTVVLEELDSPLAGEEESVHILNLPTVFEMPQESLDVVTVEFTADAFDLLVSNHSGEHRYWPDSLFQFYLQFSADEYEYFLSTVPGVKRVAVSEAGITIYRDPSTNKGWAEILVEMETRLLQLGFQPTEETSFLGAEVLRCRSVCEGEVPLKAEVAFAISLQGRDHSLTDLGIDEQALFVALQSVTSIEEVVIEAETGFLAVRQSDSFSEPWTVLRAKIETIVADHVTVPPNERSHE